MYSFMVVESARQVLRARARDWEESIYEIDLQTWAAVSTVATCIRISLERDARMKPMTCWSAATQASYAGFSALTVVLLPFLSHPKNLKYINCCLNGIFRNYFKSLQAKP